MQIDPPTPTALKDAAGISIAYASMVLSADPDPAKSRRMPRPLAIFIFRRFGWKHPSIDDLTDEQIAVLEQVEPWEPRKAQAA